MDLKRNIDATLLESMSSQPMYPVALVYVDWPDDPVFAHSGIGEISWIGNTWLGVGEVGGLSVPEEAGGIASDEAELLLVQPLVDVLDNAANQAARNAVVNIFLGNTTTPGGTTLIGQPLQVFTGYVDGSPQPDTFTLDEGGEIGVLRLRVRSGQPARAAASITHSDEDQQSRFPGDTMFRRVAHASKWRTLPPQWPAP